MEGSNPRSKRTAENKFALRFCCQSSSLKARTPFGGDDEPPTTLTKISRPPKQASVVLTILAAPSAVLTSAWINRSGIGRSVGTERAAVITRAPALLRRLTIAAPLPFGPPITRNRRP